MPTDNLVFNFDWDGTDVYDRVLRESRPITFRVGYVYDGVYERVERFGYNGNGQPITTNPTRQEVILWQQRRDILGNVDARTQGLGGWTINVHHIYDPIGHIFYGGDGTERQIATSGTNNINNIITTVTNPALPLSQVLNSPTALDITADGSLYVVQELPPNDRVVLKFAPDGSVTTVAGGGNPADGVGDGGPATSAKMYTLAQGGIAVGPDGTIYVSDTFTPSGESRIRRITPDGIITTFAGGGHPAFGVGDGGPATEASLFGVQGMALGPDGSLYITDRGNSLLRKVDPSGVITSIAVGVARSAWYLRTIA